MKKFLYLMLVTIALITHAEAQAEKVWVIPKPNASVERSADFNKPQLRELPASLNKFVSSRIVGGNQAARGDYPEFVQIYVDGIEFGDPGFLYPICGGTLIASNKVLTAAHCAYEFSASNLFAVTKFYTFIGVGIDDLVPVSIKAIHPGYSNFEVDSDIAVLTINRHANTALASVFGGESLLVGLNSTVIGVGLLAEGGNTTPDNLRKVNLPIVSNALCQNGYSQFTITGSMLCAGYANGGRDSCQGDSGGPLWVNFEGKKVQAGVVSFGDGCARPGIYGVYSRTSAYLNFIRQHAPTVDIVEEGNVIMAPIFLLLN